MDEDSKNQKEIDTWLNGEMNQDEAKNFEAKISADPNFSNLLKQRESAQKAIEYLKLQSLNNQINTWKSTMNSLPLIQKHTFKSLIFKFILGLIFAILISWILGNNFLKSKMSINSQLKDTLEIIIENNLGDSNTLNEIKLDSSSFKLPDISRLNSEVDFKEYAVQNIAKLEIPSAYRELNKTDVHQNRLDEAFQAYLDRNFTECLRILNQIQSHDSLYLDASYLKGFVYFEMRNYSLAEKTWNISLNSGFFNPDQLEWNILLCLIADNKIKKARKSINKINGDNNHTYYSKANELKKYLNL